MTTQTAAAGGKGGVRRPRLELFLISLLILFLELACIRWFPAHVLFLTFFTNTVLLACFLGMSVGCLAAGRPRHYLKATPVLLLLAVLAANGVDLLMSRAGLAAIDVGHQSSPQMVYFGTEGHKMDVAQYLIPAEVFEGTFFLLIALAMVGPGQELGRALARVPNRLQAYTVNIVGSVCGVVLFALASWCQLSPFWWFLPVALGVAYFLGARPFTPAAALRWGLLGIVLLAVRGGGSARERYWSPYYCIDYTPSPARIISVNLMGHQQMVPRDDPTAPGYAYALPHLLNRDAHEPGAPPAPPYEDVLIIGAGSGNDLSRALAWGARHVDAVEIDPVIQRLGSRDHPDHPYQDPRVSVHLDDGRNFLHSTERQYDLVVYALVDSLVLHSSYSNIRLESYLFTRQAFEDVRRRLKPGGTFVMYNYFRQGWIVARLRQGLTEVFGEEPLVLTLPARERVEPDEASSGFTLFFAGAGAGRLRQAFARQGEYWVDGSRLPDAGMPDGFADGPPPQERARWREAPVDGFGRVRWLRFTPAEVVAPPEGLRTATDDWPFLYLRQPMVPDLSLRGAAVMGVLSLVLLLFFLPRGAGGRVRLFDGHMFFLGAGFMLVETKAVVHMALLFGSTWMVNSVVFTGVLVMILAANLFVLAFRPVRLWPYYVGLLLSLAAGAVVPLDSLLGLERSLQVVASCALVIVPILFAGIIFATSFRRSEPPDLAFGANIAGAMLGGLAEYTSMLLGFQHLVLVAIGFYVLSALLAGAYRAARGGAPAEANPAELAAR